MITKFNKYKLLIENNSSIDDLLYHFEKSNPSAFNKFKNGIKGLSADEINNSSINIKHMNRDFGEDAEMWSEMYHAQEENFKPNTYYHVNTKNETPYSGAGNGFYLGRDPEHLLAFYDIEGQGFTVSEYTGNPNWLDLTDYNDFNTFKDMLKDVSINMVNSDDVSTVVKAMGYDGIRYYDHNATGEEFVLFNMNKISKQS